MKIILFANTSWYLFNFRFSFAQYLRELGHDVVLVAPLDEYTERLSSLGCRVVAAPLARRSLNPIRELRLFLWLRRFLLREHVDVIHGFTIKCAIYSALAARLTGEPRCIGSIEGLGYVFTSESLLAYFLRPTIKTLLRFAFRFPNSRLVVLNDDDRNFVIQSRLVEPSQLRLIYGSGLDCKKFDHPRNSANKSSTDVRVLLAARLLRDKGVYEYLEAARLLRKEGHRIIFLLAGGLDTGNPAAISEPELQAWMGEDLIDWMGHVTDMAGLLASVDIFVLPSYREGLPRTLVEAAASGLPVITTDVPGCREVVCNEETGLVIPARDPRALATAINRLADDPGLRYRLGSAGRERARKIFDQRIIFPLTASLYTEAPRENGPSTTEYQPTCS